MDAVRLYNLSPVLAILATGAAVAGLPLLWLWRRHRGVSADVRLHLLTWATVFLTFDLIVFGAFTRLTDSGLGCPDWPGCYGSASPLGAGAQIDAAQAAMPTGPVTWPKAWIEMIHRYLATGVGALIVLLTWLSWKPAGRGPATDPPCFVRRPHPGWSIVALLWVCLQGAFGAWTVTMKLFPAVVTLHLLGGVILLALLTAQAAQFRPRQPAAVVADVHPGTWRMPLAVVSIAVLTQIGLGGWVSTNYAVLACDTFPLCQGSWWPAMNFSQAFEWWRPLGHTASGELLSVPALTAIHYVHRLGAYVVIPLLAWVALLLARDTKWRRLGQALGVLTALQLATGLGNVLLGWPLAAAVLHTAGAAGILALLVWAWFSNRSVHNRREAVV